MNKLPAGWVNTTLQDVADINPKTFCIFPTAINAAVHFVPMSSVTEDFGGIDVTTMRPLAEVQKGYTSFLSNDVLFAKITPCMENGKIAIVPHLENQLAYGSTEFHVLRSEFGILPHWLAYYISQEIFRRFARQHMTGSAGQLRVATTWLSQVAMPVAPTAEQSRVIFKLEELLSELDAGVAELKASQKKLHLYRQSLLKAAVEGSLTADWREQRKAVRAEPVEAQTQGHPSTSSGQTDETGAELLARILKERRARWEEKQLAKFKEQGKTPPKGWQSKYPEPVAPDTTALPELPEGWVWSSIGQCFNVAVGATPSRKEPSYWGGPIPWVSSGEVQFSRISNTKEHITDDGLNNSSTQINPRGSVLLGMIGEGKTRGQVAILDIEAANNQNCAAIWASETDIPSEYVYYWLWSQYEQTRRGSSGNNQPALNKSIVEKISIPIASLEELKETTRIIDSALDSISEQEKAIEISLKQSAAQRQNILHAAFAGELVPQDPNDEPASVLLERIRAERADVGKTAKPRGRKAKEQK